MKTKDWAVIPFNQCRIKDKYLVSNVLGGWDFLDKEEVKNLSSFRFERGTPLFRRLYERGLIADEDNLESLLSDYRNLNFNLFKDTGLHIAVITTRCNLSCCYCQTKSLSPKDMDIKVASRVLKYLFDTRGPAVTLEFQGGEPLLNWNTLTFLVKQARKLSSNDRCLRITLVTNFTLADEEKMKFLADFDVEVCVSLDGPFLVHDQSRIFSKGKGTYKVIIDKIRKFKNKFGKKVNLLPTITKPSFNYFKEIIDEYVKFGQTSLALRPVNRLGSACGHWVNLGYSPEEFNQFYQKSMDYILKLNKNGIFIKERGASIILEKIINKKDPGYVDLMSPCGAGRGQIVYMPDGSCYPCDEARMVKAEMFKLGNILKEDYADLMKKDNLLHLLEASLMNLWDYRSAFSPWIGTCPVINYALEKKFVPKIHCSLVHKIYSFQFNYIFEKMLEDEKNVTIFKSWVKKEGG